MAKEMRSVKRKKEFLYYIIKIHCISSLCEDLKKTMKKKLWIFISHTNFV